MRIKFRKKNIIILTTVLVIALSVFAVVGSSLAWLTDATEVRVNAFEPAEVTCEVNEDFGDSAGSDSKIRYGEDKKEVKIINTSNIDVYIRVALIPSWKDKDGSIAPKTASLDDCNIVWGDRFKNNWFKGSDGFYYCKNPIASKSETPILINSCTVKNDTNPDLQFELQIVATAIQAMPTSAVTEAWGVTLQDSLIVSKGAA